MKAALGVRFATRPEADPLRAAVGREDDVFVVERLLAAAVDDAFRAVVADAFRAVVDDDFFAADFAVVLLDALTVRAEADLAVVFRVEAAVLDFADLVLAVARDVAVDLVFAAERVLALALRVALLDVADRAVVLEVDRDDVRGFDFCVAGMEVS
jgi:hypothetical protein